jgi:DNA ligase (NAD+)
VQVIGKMEYFFKILGNNDGFGVATIKKLYENGIRKISEIYALTHNDLTKMGFGDKTSENLIAERHKSIFHFSNNLRWTLTMIHTY